MVWSFFADDEQETADRQTASLAGLAIALLLVVLGLFLVHALSAKAAVEDCLLSGRTNCDLIIVSTR
jgi:hypothetical protein